MKATDGFVRTKENPGAVINTDNAALKAYKLKKAKEKEVDELRKEVGEMKNLLSLILDKLENK